MAKINKTVCVIDAGIFGEVAVELSKKFSRVFYCIPDYSTNLEREKIAQGMEGVEVIMDFHHVKKETDIFVFPDVCFGAVVDDMRSEGRNVFGTGAVESLEFDRWAAKKKMKALGLPVIESVKLVGIEDLKDYLQTVDNKWLKVLRHRDFWDTYHHLDWFHSDYWINQVLLPRIGAMADDEVFVIEDDIPGVEIGIDFPAVVGDQYSTRCLLGYEIKDQGNISRIIEYAQAPEQIRKICETMGPVLKEADYRNSLSYEIRVAESDNMFYLTDPCLRMANPASGIYRNVFSNFAQIVEEASAGKLIEPMVVDGAQYAVEVMICSDRAHDHNIPIEIPSDIRPFVKLKSACQKDETHYEHIPYNKGEIIGSVVAWGKTIDEAIALCKERADQIKSPDAHMNFAAFDTGKEYIKRGKKLGIAF